MHRADLQAEPKRLKLLEHFSGKGLFAVVVWGASFVATRIALEALNPFGLIAVRLWIGTLLLTLALRARHAVWLPAHADLPRCVFLGVVLAAHLLLQAYGLRYTTAIHTGWIIGFIPVTIALGAHLLRQQRLNRTGWSGVALGTAGICVVIAFLPRGFAHARFGDLLQFVSCLTWTIYTLAATRPVARNGVLRVTTFAMAVAALIATLATLGTGVQAGALTMRPVLALLFLGFICSGAAYYAWFAAVEEHGPARSGSLLYLEPFVTLVTAAALLEERITATAIAGGLCVLGGVWLVARGSVRPSAPLPTE
jgi:drug/metabolite transporter (DMT)-like permease